VEGWEERLAINGNLLAKQGKGGGVTEGCLIKQVSGGNPKMERKKKGSTANAETF